MDAYYYYADPTGVLKSTATGLLTKTLEHILILSKCTKYRAKVHRRQTHKNNNLRLLLAPTLSKHHGFPQVPTQASAIPHSINHLPMYYLNPHPTAP